MCYDRLNGFGWLMTNDEHGGHAVEITPAKHFCDECTREITPPNQPNFIPEERDNSGKLLKKAMTICTYCNSGELFVLPPYVGPNTMNC